MIKLVILVLAGYVLYRMFTNDRKKKSEENREEQERLVSSGQMVRDPVCGAYIEPQGSITVRNGDTVHHFCSYECRERYLKELEAKQG